VANAVNKYESQIGGRDLVKKHAKDVSPLPLRADIVE